LEAAAIALEKTPEADMASSPFPSSLPSKKRFLPRLFTHLFEVFSPQVIIRAAAIATAATKAAMATRSTMKLRA
jgi:hypothetical protein